MVLSRLRMTLGRRLATLSGEQLLLLRASRCGEAIGDLIHRELEQRALLPRLWTAPAPAEFVRHDSDEDVGAAAIETALAVPA